MLHSRKFILSLIAIAVVLAITVLSAVLKKYAGLDISEVARWAMVTIVSAAGLGGATIAYEDARKPGRE